MYARQVRFKWMNLLLSRTYIGLRLRSKCSQHCLPIEFCHEHANFAILTPEAFLYDNDKFPATKKLLPDGL